MSDRKIGFVALILIAIILLAFAFRVRNWLVGDVGLLTPHASPDLLAYLEPAREALNGNNPYALAIKGAWPNLPANSPLYLVFIAPLALIDWNMALLTMLIINLGTAITIILLLEIFFFPKPFNLWRFVLVTITFLAIAPTSGVIQLGQTTLIVFLAALIAIIMLPKSQIIAGIFFGFALSKYSLTFLIVPYLLIEKHYKALLVACLVQLVGLLCLSWLVSVEPIQLLRDYAQMASGFTTSITEFNLHSRLFEIGAPPIIASIIQLTGILATILLIGRYLLSGTLRSAETDQIVLVPLLLIGAIPFVYHRLYDGAVFILLSIPLILTWANPAESVHDRRYKYIVTAITGFVFMVLLYPRPLLDYYPPLRIIGFYPETIAALGAWMFLVVQITVPTKKNSTSNFLNLP